MEFGLYEQPPKRLISGHGLATSLSYCPTIVHRVNVGECNAYRQLWFMLVGLTFDQLYLAITSVDLGNAMSRRDDELVYFLSYSLL